MTTNAAVAGAVGGCSSTVICGRTLQALHEAATYRSGGSLDPLGSEGSSLQEDLVMD